MNIDQLSSRRDAEEYLRSCCERCLGYLKELCGIHLAIDSPKGTIATSNPGYLLRLRKAHFHIRAITSWPVDSNALHLMGPDIRTARKYLEPMVKEQLYDDRGTIELAQQRRYLRDEERHLIFFSHPTPATLIHPRDRGGLGRPSTGSVLLNLFILLSELVVDYGLGLAVLAEDVDRSKQSDLLEMIDRVNAESASFSLDKLLPHLEDSN